MPKMDEDALDETMLFWEDIEAEEELNFDGQLAASHLGDKDDQRWEDYMNTMAEESVPEKLEEDAFEDEDWSDEFEDSLGG